LLNKLPELPPWLLKQFCRSQRRVDCLSRLQGLAYSPVSRPLQTRSGGENAASVGLQHNHRTRQR
jgi:hypothetical protein